MNVRSGMLLQTVGITVGRLLKGSARVENTVNTKQPKNTEHVRLLWHASRVR